MSSLDQLNGIPCDSGAGTTQLSYGSGGAVSITCVTPTPTSTATQTISPSPDNTCATAQAIGSLSPLGNVIQQGINVGSSAAWYTISINSNVSSFGFIVGGTPVGSAPAGSDVMNVYTNCTGTTVSGGSDVTSYSGTAPGTYYVQVIEGSTGADGGFTLSASAS